MGVGTLTKTTLGFGDVVGDIFNVGGAVMDYNAAKQDGHSTAVSAAKAVGSFVFDEMVFGSTKHGLLFGLAYGAATVGTQLAMAAGQNTTQILNKRYETRGKLGSGYFNMSQAGYTMRQRSLNAIRSNGLNTQNALGNEARMYNRSI